ncbi:uncharacterized protein LOC131381303 isoform X1 [Hylobates moloch]|uniref:uncharacterized protein LOC131381303 isoform X1 n=1 Tax=Hylobates moloch TaxID=81572 RepID=UPI002674729C|nr:uncharacterized protein LOC131381303 isoform X1 [Hylobates moloch]
MRDAHWRPQRRVLGSPPGLSARAGDVLGGGPAPSLPEAPLSRPDRPGPWRPVGSALEESPRQQRPRSPPFRQDSQNTAAWPRDHLPETPARPEVGRRNKAMMTNAAFLVYFQSHNKPETRNSWERSHRWTCGAQLPPVSCSYSVSENEKSQVKKNCKLPQILYPEATTIEILLDIVPYKYISFPKKNYTPYSATSKKSRLSFHVNNYII